ncbi:MAG: nickel pincer cofactor biosynthesis protein LarB [Planctomycetota bacterium]|nr:nickel pincer cofactor biosynthesis protein LarB [Planctomycetota bacterium]
MNRKSVEELLEGVRRGDVDVADAATRLAGVLPGMHDRHGPVAHLDHHRALRCGFPEVVFGEAKTPGDLVEIAHGILERSESLLVTRVDAERVAALQSALPDAEHHERARAVTVRRGERTEGRRGILIVTAGTGDVPVAEEARVTAEMMGQAPEALHDVGVAGIHRVLGESERLREARVVVVAAGMEGALPSVVGGLVGVPVIAVPTSVGYGLALDGLAPLLGMMNACAPNVCVVNIDNGFGAGYLASLINRPEGG